MSNRRKIGIIALWFLIVFTVVWLIFECLLATTDIAITRGQQRIRAAVYSHEDIRLRMAYHGVNVAHLDGGLWVFRNLDGRVCKLF